ncbi:branched-chain amino acid ABC transporter, permease protein [Peptostreptococcaceae bacterium AS15]|nr:branched-chain amino acid ABC transporter, permease protein [Peptostreptococcaceae bacterium AS15]
MGNALLMTSIEQGLIFSVLAMGLYISYKVLDIADLSVEGSFPLGAFIFAVLSSMGFNPVLAMLVAFVGGLIAGLITATLFIKLKITPLLSGILTLNILYSINLAVGLGKVNISLFNSPIIFGDDKMMNLLILFAIVVVIKIILDLFFKTEMGYLLVATGDNEILVRSLGQNSDKFKILGLMLSNGLVSVAGALMAQSQKFADANMGVGIIVYALASIIIGDTILRNSQKMKGTLRAIIGAIIYKLVWGFALQIGINANYLRATTSVIVIVFIAYNNIELGRKLLSKKK